MQECAEIFNAFPHNKKNPSVNVSTDQAALPAGGKGGEGVIF